jgi:hypothetical protein
MTRRAARITKIEVERVIAAVQACGLPVARVTFDGERVDVIISGEPAVAKAVGGPRTFQSWEEYDAWQDARRRSKGNE